MHFLSRLVTFAQNKRQLWKFLNSISEKPDFQSNFEAFWPSNPSNKRNFQWKLNAKWCYTRNNAIIVRLTLPKKNFKNTNEAFLRYFRKTLNFRSNLWPFGPISAATRIIRKLAFSGCCHLIKDGAYLRSA